MAEPFLKWVGGKRKLIPILEPLLPKDLDRLDYCEPFLGGGAMFFHLSERLSRGVYLGDCNFHLIHTYIGVKDQLEDVLLELEKLKSCTSKEDFYRVRTAFNQAIFCRESLALRTARFIYLNKLCFNGIYRVNRKGEFNVPYGRYKSPTILERKKLVAASNVLKKQVKQGVGLVRRDFSRLDPAPQTFIYLDPPYDPVSETANFTSYTSDAFSWSEQERLALAVDRWSKLGCKVMLSQSDTPRIRELYDGLHFTEIQAARSVAAKAKSRRAVGELVIRNYED